MFLLGAVLVGGVLGFSADRVAVHFRDKNEVQSRIERSSWMDALGLDQIQRSHVEAILDSTNCRVLLLTAPLEPVIDSVRRVSRAQWQAVLTDEQRARLDERRRQDSVRRAVAAAERAAARTKQGEREGGAGEGGPGAGGPAGQRSDRTDRPRGPISEEYCRAMLKGQVKQ
jgi:hypothetical protein